MKKFEYSFSALWTGCLISVINENDENLNKIINNCYNKTLSFEQEFSRFRTDSVLSKLNKEKRLKVSEDFLSLVYKSREIYKLTNAYFNPLIDVRKIWYINDFDKKEFRKLEINEDLSFDKVKNYWDELEIWENMNLDFWSIAKWFLAQKLSDYLTEKWYKNNLVNLWWDIYASWLNLEWKKWQIAISSPFLENENIDIIEISNESISTSWIYKRKWKIDWKKYHHIRNPFSSKTQNEIVSASIIHQFWYMTDWLATWVIAMWKQKAIDFCKNSNIKFMFIFNDWKILKEI